MPPSTQHRWEDELGLAQAGGLGVVYFCCLDLWNEHGRKCLGLGVPLALRVTLGGPECEFRGVQILSV